ncbi:MAG: glycosyltransferase family 4 protein [Candidatus Cloacimonetes bacterium]|nr:glycosyltransferase family 4 protein [Candidatus Cloacimonadota bacterium]
MKILLINHFPLQGSGSGIYTMNIANQLVNSGHEVFVIDLDNVIDSNNYNFSRRTIICNKFENPGAELDFNFPCFTTHPRSFKTFYDLSENEIEEYVDVFSKITNDVCKKFKPDVIHAQHLWITPYIAYKTGIPYIVTAHGTDLIGFRQDQRYHRYALIGAKNAHKIITISKQVHQDVLDLYKVGKDNLKLIPNGFDTNIFRVQDFNRKELLEKFGLNTAPEKIVSFVGKFTSFKGIDTLLYAAHSITKKISKVAFILAGNGELMQNMIEISQKENLDNIFFLGHQNQNDISLLYNLADVSVVPSRIEPFGLVAIEALAWGTPVVATNAGGLPDFINDKVGKLVEMEKPELLAEAIIQELANNTKKTKGKYAAKYALDNYSWEHSLKEVIQLLNSAVK